MNNKYNTETMLINTTKSSKSAKHIRWALPVVVGATVGIVPLGFGIYTLVNPRPVSDLKIVRNLMELNHEIAEEFLPKGSGYLPNFDFIRYITVGEMPLSSDLENQFRSRYPEFENTIEKDSFKFIVTREDGTRYEINENESSSLAIFNHGYDYKIYDLFNVDIPNYLKEVVARHPIPAGEVVMDDIPPAPDWSEYEPRMQRYNPNPQVTPPAPVSDAGLRLLESQRPTIEDARANLAGTKPVPVPEPTNFPALTFEQFTDSIHRGFPLATNVNGYTLGYEVSQSNDELVKLFYIDRNLERIPAAVAAANDLPPVDSTPQRFREAYIQFLNINELGNTQYASEMFAYNLSMNAWDTTVQNEYTKLLDEWTQKFNSEKNTYDQNILEYNREMQLFTRDQERMAAESHAIDAANQNVIDEFIDAMTHYKEVELPEWESELDAASQRVISAMHSQIDELRNGSENFVSPFSEDKSFFNKMIYDEIFGIFPASMVNDVTDVYSKYKEAVGMTVGNADPVKVAEIIEKYFDGYISKDDFLANPNLTISDIPYFMGIHEASSVAFEYKIASNTQGFAFIPVQSMGDERINTFWLRGENEVRYTDAEIYNLRHNERGEE